MALLLCHASTPESGSDNLNPDPSQGRSPGRVPSPNPSSDPSPGWSPDVCAQRRGVLSPQLLFESYDEAQNSHSSVASPAETVTLKVRKFVKLATYRANAKPENSTASRLEKAPVSMPTCMYATRMCVCVCMCMHTEKQIGFLIARITSSD